MGVMWATSTRSRAADGAADRPSSAQVTGPTLKSANKGTTINPPMNDAHSMC
jgi:hypothetical protein